MTGPRSPAAYEAKPQTNATEADCPSHPSGMCGRLIGFRADAAAPLSVINGSIEDASGATLMADAGEFPLVKAARIPSDLKVRSRQPGPLVIGLAQPGSALGRPPRRMRRRLPGLRSG